MAQPTRYTPSYDFSDFQASSPTTPLPGAQVDAQLDAIATTTDEICDNLALIQRDDGELRNNSVGNDQLKSEVSVGLNAVTDWETATAYAANDGVWEDSGLYRCLVAHTSGTFSADLAAGKWSLIVDLGGKIETLAQPFVDQAQSAASEADTYADAVSGIGLSFRYAFSTTTTDADPGAGNFRLNNATQTSATELYISDVDGNAANVAALIAKFDDSTSAVKGQLSIRNRSNPGQYLEFDVTGLTDDMDYTKLTLANGAGSAASPFSNAAVVVVGFVPTGDKGDTGTGDMTGPASATDGAVARFDGTTGKLLKDGPAIGAATGNLVQLVDVGGNPGLPAVDGSQLTGLDLARPTETKSGAYTVVAGDVGKVLSCTGSFTLSLTAAATLGNGFLFGVANAGAGVITIDPGGSETIDGRATIKVYAGERFDIVCDGTTWRTLGRSRQPVLVSTVLSTAVAQVDFEVGFDDDEITKLSIDALITQTGVNNDCTLEMRFKKSGSYITGGSYTRRFSLLSTTYSGAQDGGQSSIETPVQVDINDWAWVKFDISPTRGSTPGLAEQFVQGMGAGIAGGRDGIFQGFETTAAPLQGVRMYLSNENFAANSRFALIAHRGL